MIFTEAKDSNNSTMNITEVCEIYKFDNLTSLYNLSMGNKIEDLKVPLMSITNMTETEFGNLYNATEGSSSKLVRACKPRRVEAAANAGSMQVACGKFEDLSRCKWS